MVEPSRPSHASGAQPHSNPSSSSTTTFRHRPLGRSTTGFGELQAPAPGFGLRRASTLSDSVSEARNSIRSSTDSLFLPRVAEGAREELEAGDESAWHSAPLALALLPALSGLFFKNGSVVVTDITLLVLAAVFLNWSIRLPWAWYHSAQAVIRRGPTLSETPTIPGNGSSSEEEEDEAEEQKAAPATSPTATTKGDTPRSPAQAQMKGKKSGLSPLSQAASKEIELHELAALFSCFVFPLIGTWLLHGIRSQLSRPSEGLVSNYNLTIFLLAAEVRPVSHLLKMVQARTLHLQRLVAASGADDEDTFDATNARVHDLNKRIEELETHVAASAAERMAGESTTASSIERVKEQATTEARQGVQPELDALNRAVRRYEKKTMLAAMQTDARLRELEMHIKDAVGLATAAAQRSEAQQRNFAFVLLDWACAAVMLPVQTLWALTRLPAQILAWSVAQLKTGLGLGEGVRPTKKRSERARASRKDGKAPARTSSRNSPQNTPEKRSLRRPSG